LRRQNHADNENFTTWAAERFRRSPDREGRYSSVSEYTRDLIRSDEKRKAEDRLTSLLPEGLGSEESDLTRGDFEAIRQQAIAMLKSQKKLNS